MKINRSLAFVIIALLLLGLAACTRSLPGAKSTRNRRSRTLRRFLPTAQP